MDRYPSEYSPTDSPAEEIRLRYRYRQLLLRSRVRLPRQVLLGLVGPDCAYHLYRWEASERRPAPGPRLAGDFPDRR